MYRKDETTAKKERLRVLERLKDIKKDLFMEE